MKYTKPEVVLTADAVSAIQNMAKHMAVTDNVVQDLSTTAYESDE